MNELLAPWVLAACFLLFAATPMLDHVLTMYANPDDRISFWAMIATMIGAIATPFTIVAAFIIHQQKVMHERELAEAPLMEARNAAYSFLYANTFQRCINLEQTLMPALNDLAAAPKLRFREWTAPAAKPIAKALTAQFEGHISNVHESIIETSGTLTNAMHHILVLKPLERDIALNAQAVISKFENQLPPRFTPKNTNAVLSWLSQANAVREIMKILISKLFAAGGAIEERATTTGYEKAWRKFQSDEDVRKALDVK